MRRTETQAGVGLFLAHLKAEYGEERRDGIGTLLGHGDRITYEKGHYKLAW